MPIHVVIFALGSVLVFVALFSAVRTFVVPRGTPDDLTRAAFVMMRYVFELPFRLTSNVRREHALSYYAPVTLLPLPVLWLACILLGYAAISWALGASSWSAAITASRLSLLTLGSE